MNRLVAILLMSAAVAVAQTNRKAISGTVTDQSKRSSPALPLW
jgi:hypothetical protein